MSLLMHILFVRYYLIYDHGAHKSVTCIVSTSLSKISSADCLTGFQIWMIISCQPSYCSPICQFFEIRITKLNNESVKCSIFMKGFMFSWQNVFCSVLTATLYYKYDLLTMIKEISRSWAEHIMELIQNTKQSSCKKIQTSSSFTFQWQQRVDCHLHPSQLGVA